MPEFLANLSWDLPTWDLFIYVFFVLASLIYGISLGRARVLVILVSVYMSLAITTNLPFVTEEQSQSLGFGPVYVMKMVLFLSLVAISFLLFSRMGIFEKIGSKTSFPIVMVFSFLHVGLFISSVMLFVPTSAIQTLSDSTRVFFDSDLGRFLWLIAPIFMMYLAKASPED